MPATTSWPAAGPTETLRLRLEPLRVEHAREAVSLFNDERLYAWIGGSPDTLEQLEGRYRRQSAGQSPDGTQGWLNWMMRRVADERLIGTIQATLCRPASGRLEAPASGRLQAELAWVVGTEYQGNGYAREGALAAMIWLRAHGVDGFFAHIHPGHTASMRVAQALGLSATAIVSDDGEVRWDDKTGAGRPYDADHG